MDLFLGRSGCGKSTLLRYLANLLDTKVTFSGSLSTNTEENLKDQIAYMAQQDLLMPWLTALENVLLSEKFSTNTKKSQNDKKQQINKAKQLLQQVGLTNKMDLFAAATFRRNASTRRVSKNIDARKTNRTNG